MTKVRKSRLTNDLKEFSASLILAVGFAALFQTTAFATYYIPSESMVPTLEVGDRLATAKYAYGWSRHSLAFGLSLPSRLKGRIFREPAARGDIAVFMHPRNGERMIKRVVGVPGDRVAVRRGRLWLNGAPVPRTFQREYLYRDQDGALVEVAEHSEHLPGGATHAIIERTGGVWKSNMAEISIPPGHYFMMGDNRDNSADSRFAEMGLVKEELLVGRADAILYSFYDCRPEPGVSCAEGRRYAAPLR
jgi:signal peptidase I